MSEKTIELFMGSLENLERAAVACRLHVRSVSHGGLLVSPLRSTILLRPSLHQCSQNFSLESLFVFFCTICFEIYRFVLQVILVSGS